MPRSGSTHLATLRAAIKDELRNSESARNLCRLNATLLVHLGFGCPVVAGWLEVSARSVERWTRAYEQHGVAVLREIHGGGRPASMSPGQMQQLARELGLPPSQQGLGHSHWSGKLLALHLSQRYGVVVSARQCQRLLSAAGNRQASLVKRATAPPVSAVLLARQEAKQRLQGVASPTVKTSDRSQQALPY